MTNAEANVVDDDMESEDGDQMVTIYTNCLLWENCKVTICDVSVFLGICFRLANTRHIWYVLWKHKI